MIEKWLTERDFHIHSKWSDGEGAFDEIIAECRRKGLKRIAVCDHFEFGHPADCSPCLAQYLGEFAQAKVAAAAEGITILLGIETGVNAAGELLAPSAIVEQADVVIASAHKINLLPGETSASLGPDARWTRYKEQVATMVHTPHVDVIGHVEAYLPEDYSGFPPTTFAQRQQHVRDIAEAYLPLSWYEQIGKEAAARGVAFELHGMSGSPRLAVVRILHECGAKFSIGSDGHRLSDIGRLADIALLAAAAQLSCADFAAFTHD